jgi:hypothetical protein
MSHAEVRSIHPETATFSGDRRWRWFFPGVASVLLVGLVVGFGKTFFLRSLLFESFMPVYLSVHGAVLTTWYVLVVIQTCLVASRQTGAHRRLGAATVAVGALVVPISAFVVVRSVPRFLASGFDQAFVGDVVVGDSLSLIAFSLLLAAAVQTRLRPDIHKRLMMMSCFMIYGPVFARYDIIYGVHVPIPAELLLLPALWLYDFGATKRPHRTTVWCTVLWVGVYKPLHLLLNASGVGDAAVAALR